MTTTNPSGCNAHTLNVGHKEQSLNVSCSKEESLILMAEGQARKKERGNARGNAKVN